MLFMAVCSKQGLTVLKAAQNKLPVLQSEEKRGEKTANELLIMHQNPKTLIIGETGLFER